MTSESIREKESGLVKEKLYTLRLALIKTYVDLSHRDYIHVYNKIFKPLSQFMDDSENLGSSLTGRLESRFRKYEFKASRR